MFPGLQFKTGLKQRGKKAEQRVTTGYLDGVLANFSGYIAVDELYDGPFCVLSIVDNHNFKRLIYEVLDHDPTHKDITRFFHWFGKELNKRDLKLLAQLSQLGIEIGTFDSARAVSFHHKAGRLADGCIPWAAAASAISP